MQKKNGCAISYHLSCWYTVIVCYYTGYLIQNYQASFYLCCCSSVILKDEKENSDMYISFPQYFPQFLVLFSFLSRVNGIEKSQVWYHLSQSSRGKTRHTAWKVNSDFICHSEVLSAGISVLFSWILVHTAVEVSAENCLMQYDMDDKWNAFFTGLF